MLLFRPPKFSESLDSFFLSTQIQTPKIFDTVIYKVESCMRLKPFKSQFELEKYLHRKMFLGSETLVRENRFRRILNYDLEPFSRFRVNLNYHSDQK